MTIDKDYLTNLILEAVEDGEQCKRLLDLVDRPKGEWIDENGTYYANCSKCGYQMDTHQERGYFRYCPNCGSDNRGKSEYCEHAKNLSGDIWECDCFLDTYCEHQIYDRNTDGTLNIVKCGERSEDE